MDLPVILLGAGGHAKVLINILNIIRRKVIGIVTPDEHLWGMSMSGIPVLGGDNTIETYLSGEIEVVNGIGSIGDPTKRVGIFDRMKNRGYKFVTLIHPSAILSEDVVLGEGTQIMAGTVIQPGCRIGVNVLVNTSVTMDHDCNIGDHVHLATGATLAGEVYVGSKTHIGASAVIIQGVSIGESSLIGAGSVIIEDIPSGVKAFGVPARTIGQNR
jgi:sugar O-acyltransferase (sialic acid O-acetyltransferase NeuD family)